MNDIENSAARRDQSLYLGALDGTRDAEVQRLSAALRSKEAECEGLLVENDRLRQDRSDALSVYSKEGLLSSEWIARTGKAERERNEAQRDLAEARAALGRMQSERDEARVLIAWAQGAMLGISWRDDASAELSKVAGESAARLESALRGEEAG